MSGDVRASVVIVTFQSSADIRGCLDALLATISEADEVIVVDNDSRDDTAALVAAYEPRVRLIRSARNLGYGGGSGLGARSSKGRVVVFLNPDTTPLPGWLDALLEALTSAPHPVLVTPKLVLARDRARIDALGNAIHIGGITPARKWGRLAASERTVEEVSAVSGACFALARTTFDALGGFDERLFLYYEDTELSLRARLAGHRILAVAASEVAHDHTPGFTASKLFYLERNRWWAMLKLFRGRTLLALAPALLLTELLTWAFAIASGPGHVAAKARAWLALLRWLPALPAARAQAAGTRVVGDRELLRAHSARLPLAQLGGRRGAGGIEALLTALFALSRAFARALAG